MINNMHCCYCCRPVVVVIVVIRNNVDISCFIYNRFSHLFYFIPHLEKSWIQFLITLELKKAVCKYSCGCCINDLFVSVSISVSILGTKVIFVMVVHHHNHHLLYV